jgi:predicted DCC family thiol-disulfide oxidoreductase YuxK
MAHGRALEVWYDGQCPVCRASRDWCAARDPGGRLEFRDIRAASEFELPVSRAAAEASMWVRGDDGALAEGFAGWRRILAELPGWRWIAWVSGAPPLRWLGPPIYRMVARARGRLPG